MLEGTEHSALTKGLCLTTTPNLAESDARVVLKSLVLHRIGMGLLCGSICSKHVGKETKEGIFSFCCLEVI